MRRDPYNNEKKWAGWKEKNKKKIKGIKPADSKLILEFLKDMEEGMNTPPSKQGRRSPTTLINLKDHICFFSKHTKKNLLDLTKKDLHNLDRRVREGKILKKTGKPFKAFGNYIKDFKSFWGWIIRTGKRDENIAVDLSKKTDKPSWVYLGEDKIKKFFNQLLFNYKAMCFLLYDSGMRVTEANSIRVQDFSEDFKKLTIPEEAAKTFGRTINLKICSGLMKEYVEMNKLGAGDFIFIKKTHTFNKYLKENCKRIFGEGISNEKSRGKYPEFTIYDIRHNSACHWYNYYPTTKGLMYRFGWKREEEVAYYSEFLGVNDELTDDDMLIQEDKTKLEEDIERLKLEMKRLQNHIVKGSPVPIVEIIKEP